MTTESDSESGSEEGIISFFQSDAPQRAAESVVRKSAAQLFMGPDTANEKVSSPAPKRSKVGPGPGESRPIMTKGTMSSVVDSRAFFEEEDAEQPVADHGDEAIRATRQPLPSIFECHICLRRLDMKEKETDSEQIAFVYPSEKPSIEVCKNCLRRDKAKAHKLDAANNKVEYNLAAKCLMPTACKVCGSYEHGSYECMIPQGSHDENSASGQAHDPTAPYR